MGTPKETGQGEVSGADGHAVRNQRWRKEVWAEEIKAKTGQRPKDRLRRPDRGSLLFTFGVSSWFLLSCFELF